MTNTFTNKDVENHIKKQAHSQHKSALNVMASLAMHAIIYGGAQGTVSSEAKEAAGFYKVVSTKYSDVQQLAKARISAVSRPAQVARLVARIALLDKPIFEYTSVPAYTDQSITDYRTELSTWLEMIKSDQGLKGERLKDLLVRLEKNVLPETEAAPETEADTDLKAGPVEEIILPETTEDTVTAWDAAQDQFAASIKYLQENGLSPISNTEWTPESWALFQEALVNIDAVESAAQAEAAA